MSARAFLLLGMLATACAEPSSVPELHLLCDGTGEAGAGGEACTSEFLLGRYDGWAAYASVAAPGSGAFIIPTAGAYAETAVVATIVVPAATNRYERALWQEHSRAIIKAIKVPQDSPGSGRARRSKNQSDLLSALLKSAMLGQERGRPVDVWIASDGRFISLHTFNVDSGRVPSVLEVTKVLAHAGIPFSESTFAWYTRVSFCGVTGEGMTAAAHQALRTFLVDFIVAGGGPVPQVVSSCRLVPPWTPPPPMLPPPPASRGL